MMSPVCIVVAGVRAGTLTVAAKVLSVNSRCAIAGNYVVAARVACPLPLPVRG